jgi:hypothetical protein
MQHLVQQPQHLALGRDRQRVMRDVAPPAAGADLAELFPQHPAMRVIQLGAVVNQQDHAVVLDHSLERLLPMRRQHRLVRHLISRKQPVQTHRLGPAVAKLLRQAAAGMPENVLRGIHQSPCAPYITQSCRPEVPRGQSHRDIHVITLLLLPQKPAASIIERCV